MDDSMPGTPAPEAIQSPQVACGWSRLTSVHMLLYRGLCALITGDWGAGHRMTARSFEAHSTTGAPIDPRTRVLLEGPIAATLVRLAAPNVVVMIVQASVGLIETYFIGWFGNDALAGVALVFPPLMLMQMMSAGAMGGGISSAVARALGGGRTDADALAVHALAIAVAFGLFFMVGMLGGGRWIHSAMGGK